ncbi:MAG: hypothetical protein O7C75_17920 [Verrucomicrobia bacterium]|nr:hypothetical protein [Verrucomicrobiota bacterium]
MTGDKLWLRGRREVRWMGIFRDSPALHFYLMQAVVFSYMAFRLLSRSYEAYGNLPDEFFDFPRRYVVELWPIPAMYFTSFQFIYEVLPRPAPEVIFGLQLTAVGACLLGLAGIVPRFCAVVAFLIGTHLTGFIQATNADVDGGGLALCLLLVLALSPERSYYSLKNGWSLERRSVDYHWPVFLFWTVVGAFYTCSGLNKMIDVGPHWPFVLHLENLAQWAIEKSLFISSHYSQPLVASFHLSPHLSLFAGMVSFIGELGFITILFLPRYRLFFVLSMVGLHYLVLNLAGINFLGNSALLLLCVDWNALVRKIEIRYDEDEPFWQTWAPRIKRLDWFGRVSLKSRTNSTGLAGFEPESIRGTCVAQDENGEIYAGIDVLEQVATRCPMLLLFSLAMKIPGLIYLIRPIMNRSRRKARVTKAGKEGP